MTIKLTDKERKLIEVILDYEKAYIKLTDNIADSLGMVAIDAGDLVPFDKIAQSIGLDSTLDITTEIIYGYVSYSVSIKAALLAIEACLNGNYSEAERLVSL